MSFSRSALALLLGTCLALGAPEPASAASGPSARRQAKGWYKTGRAHMKAKRYAEASEAFETAFGLDPAPPLLWNLARALELGRKLDAAKKRYVDLLGMDRLKHRLRKQVLLRIKALDARMEAEAAAKPKLPPDDPKITTGPVDPGLGKPETPRDPKTPIEAVKPEGPPKTALKGPLTGIDVRKESGADGLSGMRVAGWATLGTGVALGATAAILHVLAEGKRSEVTDPSGRNALGAVTSVTQARAAQLEDEANTFDSVALGAAIAGGAALITGLVLLLLPDGSEQASVPAVSVGAGPGKSLWLQGGVSF